MRINNSLLLAKAIMQKRAYMSGIQNIGGLIGAGENPWIGHAIHPEVDMMKNSPFYQHIQNVWGGNSQGNAAPKLPTPQPVVEGSHVATGLPQLASPGMNMGASGGAPSFLPKAAMMAPPKFPTSAKMPGLMTGPAIPASAKSIFKPVGAQHRPAPAMGHRFGGANWFMGGGAGSGNGGTPDMGAGSFTAPMGGSTAGPGTSAGTTGGGDSGAAGQK